MGGSASKTARSAGAAARQYPKRNPASASGSANTATTSPSFPSSNSAPQPPPASRSEPGPTVHPQSQATDSRSAAINLDASDPDFARSLRSLGPVQPNPTMSQTSAFQHPNNMNRNAIRSPSSNTQPMFPDPRKNPAIAVLDARSRLQVQADEEGERYGKSGFEGREFLDVFTIRRIMVLRDGKGTPDAEIEKQLGLKKGTVARLGPRGIVSLADEVGRGEREISMV